METRKVQLSGGTTYTVSLPKRWASEHGIEAGSLLYLHPDEGSLLLEIDGQRDADERVLRVDISSEDDAAVRRSVETAYLVGYDTVRLVDRTGDPGRRRHLVTDLVDRFSGFEILESTDSTTTVRNLISVDSVSIRKSALRLHLIALAMHRDAVTAVVEHDRTLAREVAARDAEADKLCALVSRHFQRALTDLHEADRLGCSRVELFDFYLAVRQLERVADHAEKMADLTAELDGPLPAPFSEAFPEQAVEARRLVERACDAVFADGDGNPAAAHRVVEDCERHLDTLDDLGRDLFEHDDPGVAHVVSLLFDSVHRTTGYAQNIAEIGLQQELR